MIVTVFGATGMVGKQVIKQALAMDYTVKAFGRNIDQLIMQDLVDEHLETIKGALFDEAAVLSAIEKSDAIISVIGGAFNGEDKARSLGIKNIITQMQKAGVKRIVALGGMGVLNADENTLLIDKPGYPEIYKPVGREHVAAFRFLESSGLNWTFVCAPNIKDENATGNYFTNKNYPPPQGNETITAGDIAAFMLKEITSNEYIKYRVGISN